MFTQNSGNPTINGGLRRPDWICQNCHQHVFLTRDGSGSMAGQKGEEASRASSDLVAELASPSNKNGFYVTVIDFNTEAETVHAKSAANSLSGNVRPLGAWLLSGGTNITAGLHMASEMIDSDAKGKEQGVRWLRPVVICFTDGQHNTGPSPETVATELKNKADLVMVAFGTDADEAELKRLATSPQHFYRCSNGVELRRFLAAVGATISASLAAGVNSTQALGKVKQ
jgi:uncharacterized protein YegL